MEVGAVSKSTITRTFVGSLVALAGGLILLVTAGGIAYANGNFIMDGADVVGVQSTPGGWALILLAVVGLLAMIGAVIAQFVAWIGAVINTSELQDKTWFIILLVCGLLSFGFIAMVIYLIAGPPDPQPRAVLPPIPTQQADDKHTPVA
jgi:hypothetical protein